VLAGEHLVEVLGGDDPEHGIAQELEPLVRFARGRALDVEVGTVRQREPQQLRVVEMNPEVARERFDGTRFVRRESR